MGAGAYRRSARSRIEGGLVQRNAVATFFFGGADLSEASGVPQRPSIVLRCSA